MSMRTLLYEDIALLLFSLSPSRSDSNSPPRFTLLQRPTFQVYGGAEKLDQSEGGGKSGEAALQTLVENYRNSNI